MPAWSEHVRLASWPLLPNLANVYGYNVILAKSLHVQTRALVPRWFPTGLSQVTLWAAYNVTMGNASYLVYRDGGGLEGVARLPMAAYVISVCYSCAWPVVFYRHLHFKLALFDIGMLCGLVAAMTCLYRPISNMAAALTVPCFCWLINVAFFNFRVWRNARLYDGNCKSCFDSTAPNIPYG
ncbi:translocator protein-like [Ornithodoros turicata]|uniref:translocator protein-like n=1 Tax=Ornithodoros turicata TaxID=34597 RepID=UPI00313918A3